jgi:exosortase/archaeosortase family protein
LILFGLSGAIFLPVFHWLTEQTISRDQIQYSVIILGAAMAVALWRQRGAVRFRFKLSRTSLGLVAAAYLLGALAILLRQPFPLLIGFLAAFVAAVIFAVGDEHFKLGLFMALGFTAFLIIVLLFPLLDMPLRKLAGIQSAYLMDLLGYETQIGLMAEDGYPAIILMVNGEIYHIATECNGFGLIISCGLLAFLVVLTGKESFIWKLFLIFAGGVAGYILNVSRIITICSVAPKYPDHYLLIHEIIGIGALSLGIGVTWWLVSPSGLEFLRRRAEIKNKN